jgi:hypothetical protein
LGLHPVKLGTRFNDRKFYDSDTMDGRSPSPFGSRSVKTKLGTWNGDVDFDDADMVGESCRWKKDADADGRTNRCDTFVTPGLPPGVTLL